MLLYSTDSGGVLLLLGLFLAMLLIQCDKNYRDDEKSVITKNVKNENSCHTLKLQYEQQDTVRLCRIHTGQIDSSEVQ